MVLKRLQYNILLPVLLLVAVACTGRTTAQETSEIPQDSVSANAPQRQLPESVTIAFTGDIMMGTTFPDSIHGTGLPPNGGKNIFDDVRDVISSADFAGGNLEGSFLNGPGKRRPMTNPKTYFIFRMPPEYVTNLLEAGYDFVGIANNHINDFGEPGRQSTMKTLRDAGLAHAGLMKYCETAYVERNGVVFGVAQVGHGDNNVDVNNLDEVRRVVRQMRDSADIVILSFHGGAEGSAHTHVPGKLEYYVGEKRGDVKAVAHAAIDAGADVVFGHGPHVVRGAELYKDHPIFYSLGNFCTPYRMGIAGLTGQAPVAVVELDMDGKFLGGKIHSFIQQRGKGPRKDPTNSAARQIRTLSRQDFPDSPLRIADDGTLSRASGNE
ncbi:MAG: CapA family protein [Paramuribaculum sp.]|nr:CapA family protein [Paramuribaculum sp.]